MGTRENILIAQPVDDAGLDRIQRIAGAATIDFRDPIRPGTVLPPEEISTRTILFADQCPANVEVMSSLRWIQLGSAGFRQLSGLALPAQTRVTNASGVNDVPIAEWCLLMMLSFVRGFPDLLRNQRDRRWARDPRFQAELRGRRVGIFGYGSIGREVARLSRGIGLEVWALSRGEIGPRPGHYRSGPPDAAEPLPDRCFQLDQLHDFLGELDFLVITAPHNKATEGLFGMAELRALPRHAVVLNPARAPIIDEPALLRALREGIIAGAALDSHYREPMLPDDPFWSAPNTVVTPHVSGSTGSTYFLPRLWELFAVNLERFLAGDPLLNEISRTDLRA